MTMPQQPLKVLIPKDGNVVAIAESTYTEKEIAEDREVIVQRLHGAYLSLVDDMQEFQVQWDSNPNTAFLDAAYEGIKAGGADWGHGIGDLFDKRTWTDIGEKIKLFAGRSYDAMGAYAGQQYNELRTAFDEGAGLVDHADDTIKNWAWWQSAIDHRVEQVRHYANQQVDAVSKTVADAKATVIDSADKAGKVYKHREAILGLPTLIASSDVDGIQNFVDTVLKDIDPDLYKAVRESNNFHIAIELIADHESALNYVSYMSLMVEAVPPNFYAYASAKYGVQLLLEVILTIACAFFTAGAGIAVRVSTLAARLISASAKVSGVARRIQKAQAAIVAFVRVLEDFLQAARDLHRLGEKLLGARVRGVVFHGKTRETLIAKKKIIKRDMRCRLCGSTEHSTPRGRLGNVVYD